MREALFYIFCFFPFITLHGGHSSDIQPYCLIYTIVLTVAECIRGKICINEKLYNLYLTIILGIIAGMTVTILLNGFDFTGVLRYLATYCGLILISYMSYIICIKNDGLNERLVKIIINIWLLVGLIQLFISRDFCNSIIANARTSLNRGVTGLASEPSFYGYMCIFFALLVLEFQTNRIHYMLNLLFQILFLAKSSVTTVYLIILFGLTGIYFLKRVNIKRMFIFISILICVLLGGKYLIEHADNGQRIIVFLKILFSGKDLSIIIDQLGADGSISIRFNDIWECIKGFITCLGLPHGFHTRKISSGYGSVLYTMGWLGAIVIVYIFYIVRSAYTNSMVKEIVPVFLTVILFSAIQLSNPVIGFLIGYYTYKRKKQFVRKMNKLFI